MAEFWHDLTRDIAPPPAAPQLQARALYEELADRVRDRILSHDFKPGDLIDEVALLKEYGISRTPVREALKVLRHEGLLTSKLRRGMSVTVLGLRERQEAIWLHQLLLAHAASRGVAAQDLPRDSLLGRMLEMVERQLRLAYGPSFEDEIGREAFCTDAPTLHGEACDKSIFCSFRAPR